MSVAFQPRVKTLPPSRGDKALSRRGLPRESDLRSLHAALAINSRHGHEAEAAEARRKIDVILAVRPIRAINPILTDAERAELIALLAEGGAR